jgi:hypothetical protein
MSETIIKAPVLYRSCLASDAWQGIREPLAFQRWRFDALSDDGREGLIVEFTDNYHLSPRYGTGQRCPAVSLVYSVDGKVIVRALNEYCHEAFRGLDAVGCAIAASSFRLVSAAYGSGFLLHLDLTTSRGRVTGELEWLSVESDLLPGDGDKDREAGLVMNLVMPRADVSGRMTLAPRRGESERNLRFRGTGYHDQLCTNGRFTPAFMCHGRVHFADLTALFTFIKADGRHEGSSRLSVVQDGGLVSRDATFEGVDQTRDRYGMRHPGSMTFATDDGVILELKPLEIVDSGSFATVMTCEALLNLGDGKARQTLGLVEFCAPDRMRHTTLRRLHDLRIKREDGTADL